VLNSVRQWRSIKSKTPIIGIDDGGFDRFSEEKKKIPIFGVVMKGASYVDGIIQSQLERDDIQATRILTEMILASPHKAQIRAILFQGITIAGFGIIDINDLWERTKIPVIVVLRKYPNFEKIHSALEKVFTDNQKRWQLIEKAGKPQKVQKNPQMFLQVAGITLENAFQLTKKCTAVGTIPEAIRIAHFIGASRYHFLND
jgi:endonuclease V-like protein UPF0215 family